MMVSEKCLEIKRKKGHIISKFSSNPDKKKHTESLTRDGPDVGKIVIWEILRYTSELLPVVSSNCRNGMRLCLETAAAKGCCTSPWWLECIEHWWNYD